MVRASPAPAPRRHCHRLFLKWLPRIRTAAAIAFRHVRGQDRDDLIAETVANAYVAMAALADRNALTSHFPSVLSRFAISQIKDGRRVDNRSNVREVLSEYSQKHKGFTVDRLDHFRRNRGRVARCSGRRPSAPAVRPRSDEARLRRLPAQPARPPSPDCQVLAKGESTSTASRKFGVSAGQDLADAGRTEAGMGSARRR